MRYEESENYVGDNIGEISVIYLHRPIKPEVPIEHMAAAYKYWQRTEDNRAWLYSVSGIAAEIDVKTCDVSKFVGKLISASISDEKCPTCTDFIYYELRVRSDYTDYLSLKKIYGYAVCSTCHKSNADKTQLERNSLLEIERNSLPKDEGLRQFRLEIKESVMPFNYDELNLIDAVYLHAWLTASGNSWDDKDFQTSLESSCLIQYDPYKPWVALRELIEKRIIFVSDLTEDSVFSLVPEGYSYNFNEVMWTLAPSIDGDIHPQALIMALDNVIENSIAREQENVFRLWRTVSLDETLGYLHNQGEQYGFYTDKMTGQAFETSLRYALCKFSIGQVRNIVWRAVKNAAALSQHKDFNLSHAINTIPGSIRKNVDKAIAESWTIKPYGRSSMDYEPLLTSILFDKVLKCGNSGYLEWSEKDVLNYLPDFDLNEDSKEYD